MSWEKASWLERDGRAETEKPEIVIAAMDLREGMTVAEIGAGTGFFTRRLARAVGPTGKVLAEEIQPQMLDLLKQNAAKEGIGNITTILGTETDPRLPPHGVDRLLLVDVYHEFQKPEPMLAKLRESLAPGGTVTLVEYRLEGDTAAHINIKHRMSVEQVLAEWNAAGLSRPSPPSTSSSSRPAAASGLPGTTRRALALITPTLFSRPLSPSLTGRRGKKAKRKAWILRGRGRGGWGSEGAGRSRRSQFWVLFTSNAPSRNPPSPPCRWGNTPSTAVSPSPPSARP
jgi:precorrin-6B methylase 2